jgi:hypothetical protein
MLRGFESHALRRTPQRKPAGIRLFRAHQLLPEEARARRGGTIAADLWSSRRVATGTAVDSLRVGSRYVEPDSMVMNPVDLGRIRRFKATGAGNYLRATRPRLAPPPSAASPSSSRPRSRSARWSWRTSHSPARCSSLRTHGTQQHERIRVPEQPHRVRGRGTAWSLWLVWTQRGDGSRGRRSSAIIAARVVLKPVGDGGGLVPVVEDAFGPDLTSARGRRPRTG